MAYPTPPSSTGSVATPAPAISFDHYVHYAGKAAELAREAILQLPTLQAKVAQLEAELDLWKSNHQQVALKAKDAQRQLNSGETVVACFLDGDGCIFDRSLIRKGRDGGREAALALRSHITDYAEQQGLHGDLTVVITLFLSKSGLAKALQSHGLADEQVFNAFLQGLNAAHPLIQVTDVGPQKEAADAKLRENIRLYSKLPSCKLVLAGCSHDGGYAHVFNTVQTESPRVSFKKLRLLHSYTAQDTAFELKRLNLESVRFDDLFEKRKLGNYSSLPTSPYSHGPASHQPAIQRRTTPVTTLTVGATPRKRSGYNSSGNASNPESSSTKPPALKLKAIDTTKPLNKQDEPLCNTHYLAPPCNSTITGEPCRYSHSYLLTTAQLAQLRTDAKKSPCIYALKGLKCRDGDACFSGHVCPRGEKCKYGKSCRFVAPGMHPTVTKARADRPTAVTSSEDDMAPLVPASIRSTKAAPNSTLPMSKSQLKKKARGEARFAKYVIELGSIKVDNSPSKATVKDIARTQGSESESESEEEEEDESSGFETASSVD
ncbi:uncharacterized protein JCM15063_006085 [Sporobolomyces koalae]|uniref:uncharacterized protein n=1 Tax=Sporobolomyces koalae TaxID=500713 RepID=UPI00316BCD9D